MTRGDSRAMEGRDAPESPEGVIPGERGISSVNRPAPLQARLTNYLAMGLVGSIAIGFLSWYYLHALASRSAASTSASTHASPVTGEMALPPLGRVTAPAPNAVDQALGGPPPDPALVHSSAIAGPSGLLSTAFVPTAYTPDEGGAARTQASPAERALERRLTGPVFSTPASNAASAVTRPDTEPLLPVAGAPFAEARPVGDLSSLLAPSTVASVQAKVMPSTRLLLPKGAFLDCTLETAIDSALPGMTTCVLATDVFGADGSVVLLERGTKLVGETRGQVRQGAARVFVLWNEARTPTGVIVPLASPGTDALGRSGLAGQVDRHFWDRFGAAILVSVIDGAVQAAAQNRSGSGAVIVSPSATRDVMTEVLRSTIDIGPTVTVAHGSRIQVLVARDVDFRSVYELRSRH